MESSFTDVQETLRMATNRFFDTEALDEFENVLQYFTVVESTTVSKLQAEFSLLTASALMLPTRVVGTYPTTFASHYGVVSMLSLTQTKLDAVKAYRETLKTILVEWEFSPKHKQPAVLEKLGQLSTMIERDQSVKSTQGTLRTEDLFIELLKSRRADPTQPFTFDLSVLDRTQLLANIAGFKNATTIPLRLDAAKRNHELFLEHVAMCLEGLAKKLTLCVYSLRVVREFITSAKGL